MKPCIEKYNYFSYLNGDLARDACAEFEKHKENCSFCASMLQLCEQTNNYFEEKKLTASNPFLFTRVMEQIEAKENLRVYRKRQILQPAIITAIVLVAMLAGFFIGNLYSDMQQNTQLQATENNFVVLEPIEMALLNE